jgi:RNA polymerase-binding transcription factor DksA
MNDNALYKIQIEEDLATITKELQSLGIRNPQLKEDWIAIPEAVGDGESDSDLVSDKTEDWEEKVATLAALETQYNELIHALTKFETGTYGTCEICSEQIESERLNANASARTCLTHMDDEIDLEG